MDVVNKLGTIKRRQRAALEIQFKPRRIFRECDLHPDSSAAPVSLASTGLVPPWNQLKKHQPLQRWKEQMVANGWCHHQADHLSVTHSPEVFR